MSTPFISEIKLFSFNYAPKGWALCDGVTLSIQQNTALFALVGTYYGGNGSTTFMLPDLRGRVPTHQGGSSMGQKGGEAVHTLIAPEIPGHTHTARASSQNAGSPLPTGKVLAAALNLYTNPTAQVGLSAETVSTVGGQPHENMSPYLTLNFCIALVGIFPSRN